MVALGLIEIVVFTSVSGYELWPAYVIIIPSVGLLLWILLQTGYAIDSTYLYYFQGPFRGKILISSVRKVERDESWIKGSLLKPALDQRGMIIAYGTFDTIFIAPKNRKLFLATLLERNPSIEIKGF